MSFPRKRESRSSLNLLDSGRASYRPLARNDNCVVKFNWRPAGGVGNPEDQTGTGSKPARAPDSLERGIEQMENSVILGIFKSKMIR